jgi:pimeloyl-ACP methyl ester carboxylesterase
MVPGGLKWREAARLIGNVRGCIALLRLLLRRHLSPRTVNRLPFFDGRLDAVQAERVAGLLQQESWRALRDLLAFRPPTGPTQVPVVVVGSATDSLFGTATLHRTAAAYAADIVVLPVGCHDLMLDPSWEVSAGVIADWVTATLPHPS